MIVNLRMAAGAVALLLLTGCAQLVAQTSTDIQRTEEQARQVQPAPEHPVFRVVPGTYMLGSAREIQKALPPELTGSVQLLLPGNRQQLGDMVAALAEASGIPIRIDNTTLMLGRTGGAAVSGATAGGDSARVARTTPTVTSDPVMLSGTVASVMDQIVARFDLSWDWRDGAIHVFKTKTVTLPLPLLNWATTTTGSISAMAGGTSGGTSGASGGSGSAAGGASGGAAAGSGSATSSVTATEDNWANLQGMAQAVAGTQATVLVDRNTGTLVMTGTPAAIDAVRGWIGQLAARMRQQVAIDVHIYSVTTTLEDTYGFNLNALYKSLQSNFGLSLSGAPTAATISGLTPGSLGVNILSTSNSPMAGSSAIAQALSTLGRVSQVFGQSTVTINGQSTSMQQAENIEYISGSTTTQTANVGAATSVQTGVLTPGFTLDFMPMINGRQITLGMNMLVSTFNSLNPTPVAGTLVDLPQTFSYTFQRSFSLNSGDTLLITGVQGSEYQLNSNGTGSPTNYTLGGGVDAQRTHQLFFIVVEAHLL